MRMQSTIKKVAFALLAGSIGFLTVSQQPAQAVVDPAVYARLNQVRQNLIVKTNQLRRDQDDIARQMDDLKSRNDAGKFDQQLDQLSKKLDDKFFQQRQTEMDLRDIEINMI